MGKIADKYFKVDEWKIIEEGFDQSHSQVAETVFSLGNEYMGVRGFFEEGYSGKKLIGSYFNGVYAREILSEGGYKGVVRATEFMVNSVNWLAAAITVDGERLDLYAASVRDFVRVLDMKTGLLTRSFVWTTVSGKQISCVFERFLSMSRANVGVQRISVTPLNFDGVIEVELASDFSELHQTYQKNYWEVLHVTSDSNFFEINAETVVTGKYLSSASCITCEGMYTEQESRSEKKIGKRFLIQGSKGEKNSVLRVVWNDRTKGTEDVKNILKKFTFEGLLMETTAWWNKVWEDSDILIEGDPENQQGIRYCIFQMMQTYHGAQSGNNIGAKGLTGEAYNGNAFWDTETYCLPFFIFNNKLAAKNLLLFRYKTLEEAKDRAKDLDCEGAFYPIATISGKECCNLWQHASLQLQASTAVAYGIWMYVKLTQEEAFLEQYGAEMLVEISRMLASRGAWSADGKNYGYYCVMGPDEFQMMVNHNCYTNLMAKFTFRYTLEVLDSDTALCQKLGVSEEELQDWKNKAEHLVILQENGLFEQHDGFFKLPHVDVAEIPVEDFPLYHHWSYDRIYRNDIIKQPDVLMFMFMFNHAFTEEQLRKNYEYYEPKCIHESSLSPSVHSILASQLKKKEAAYSFFQFATRMDLDNYNRNSEEGLHTTSIAAAWMNIVYGFGGLRSDGEMLEFTPTIPDGWKSYTFHVTYHDQVIAVKVEPGRVHMVLQQAGEVELKVFGNTYYLTDKPLNVELPAEWR